MDTSTTIPTVPSLDDTYGAMLLGTFIGLMLYGLSLHQSYRYVRMYPNDQVFIRVLVLATMLLETVHIVLSMHLCYYYLVTSYFDPLALTVGIWSIHLLPLIAGLIMIVAQLFFARRLYLVGPRYKVVVVVASIFLAAEFAFAVVATIITFQDPGQKAFFQSAWLVAVCFGMAMVADTLLTVAFIVVLRRSRTGFRGTDSTIDILVIYAINTGLITGIFNILSFSFAAANQHNFIYGAFNTITARLYANTFLAVLNSRQLMVTHGVEIFDKVAKVPLGRDIFTSAHRMATAEQWNVPRLPVSEEPAVITIKVTTETEGNQRFADSSENMSYDKPIKLGRMTAADGRR